MQLPCSTSALPEFLPVGLAAAGSASLPPSSPAGDAAAFDGALAACLAAGTPASPDGSSALVPGAGQRPPSPEAPLGMALGRAGGASGGRLLAGIGRRATLPDAGSEGGDPAGLADTPADPLEKETRAGREDRAELPASGAQRAELPPPATTCPEVSWLLLNGGLAPMPVPRLPEVGGPNLDGGVASDVATEMEGVGAGMFATSSDGTASGAQRGNSPDFPGQAGTGVFVGSRQRQVPFRLGAVDARASFVTSKAGLGSAPGAVPEEAGQIAPSPGLGGAVADDVEVPSWTQGAAGVRLAREGAGHRQEIRERPMLSPIVEFGAGPAANSSAVEPRSDFATRGRSDPLPSAGADSPEQGVQPVAASLPRSVADASLPGVARMAARDTAAFSVRAERGEDVMAVGAAGLLQGPRFAGQESLQPQAGASPARITRPANSGLEGAVESIVSEQKKTEKNEGEVVKNVRDIAGIVDAKTVLSMHDYGSTAAATVREVTPGAPRAEETAHPEGAAVASAHQAVESVMVAVDRITHHSRQSVSLDLSVAGEPLQVRVELHAGEVRATFRTDSSELRAALEQEWQARPIDSGAARVVTPVFAASSEQSWSGADGQGARRQRQPEVPADPGAFSLSGVARRQDPVSPVPSGPVRPLLSRSHQLYSLA